MQIRNVDLDNDVLMLELAEVARRSQLHERPHAPAFDTAAHVASLRAPDSSERQELVAAVGDDGVAIGFGVAWLFLRDNVEKAWLEVAVDPARRRAGAGSALLDHLVGLVRDEGRTVVMIDTKLPFDELETHPNRTFVEHRGWSLSNIEVVRHQVLPVSEAEIATWAARADERASDYRIRTFVNEMPDELVPSLCVLLGQLGADAPTGAVDFEEEDFDAERLAERYALAEAMDADRIETVALTHDGTVAAQSTILVPRSLPDAFQWGTFVHREHRGHSLGLAVKAANLRELQRRHPHTHRVVTQNGETNEWMIAINELMGYRPVEAAAEFVLRL